MKKLIILFLCCLMGYQGCPQKNHTNPLVSGTVQWTEQQIIDILKRGDLLFCKYDLILERNDTMFYVKNMELPLQKDLFFDSAYLESSIVYGENEKDRQTIHCIYLIMNDRVGNALEISENELVYLPRLANYLDTKVRKTPLKECNKYIPLDGKYGLQYSGDFFYG